MDGPQAGIARASAVFPDALQVFKEETNKGRIEVFDQELGGHFAESVFGKMQKQPEAIAIPRYRMRARLLLAKQALRKEGLKWRSKVGGHQRSTFPSISRSVAS